jgi:transcriptional regulator with XRE-family HTH domain
MTRKDLAKALGVSPSQITRYINEKGMAFPISVSEAKEWHDSVILDQGPRKAYVESDDKPKRSERPEPEWIRQERQEVLLAKEIAQLDAKDGKKLESLRQQYEEVAAIVLLNHLDLIDAAIQRRLLTCPGFSPDEAFEKYVNALSGLVDKWQGVLDTEDDEEPVESS